VGWGRGGTRAGGGAAPRCGARSLAGASAVAGDVDGALGANPAGGGTAGPDGAPWAPAAHGGTGDVDGALWANSADGGTGEPEATPRGSAVDGNGDSGGTPATRSATGATPDCWAGTGGCADGGGGGDTGGALGKRVADEGGEAEACVGPDVASRVRPIAAGSCVSKIPAPGVPAPDAPAPGTAFHHAVPPGLSATRPRATPWCTCVRGGAPPEASLAGATMSPGVVGETVAGAGATAAGFTCSAA